MKSGLFLTPILSGAGQPCGADVSRQVEQLVLAEKWPEARQALPPDTAAASDPTAALLKGYACLRTADYPGAAAVNRLLEMDWSTRPLFPPASPLSLGGNREAGAVTKSMSRSGGT